MLLDVHHLEILLELENGVINELSQYCRDLGEEDSYQIWNLTTLAFIPALKLEGMRVKQHSSRAGKTQGNLPSTDRHQTACMGPICKPSNFRQG